MSSTIKSLIKSNYLCALGPEFQRYEPNNCPMCAANSPEIPIQPSTYLLETTAHVIEVAIGIPHVGQSNDFFKAYAGTGCISIHRTQHDATRHHMLFIDVKVLLGTVTFCDKIETKIAELQNSFDVILAPQHESAILLAEKVAKFSGKRIVICDQQDLSSMSLEQKSHLRGKKVLLVDDVFITGARLNSYRICLNAGGFAADGFDLFFLVGVARPESKAVFKGVNDMIHPAENFHYIETILLPDWREEDCPWCIEKAKIDHVMERVEEVNTEIFASRYDLLSNTKLGIQSNIFLYWSSVTDCQKLLTLGPGSIFSGMGSVPLTQVELFANIASTIQYMRSEGILNEVFTTPIARVLDSDRSFRRRYYERIIPACILRATKYHDFTATKTSKQVLKNVHIMLEDEVALELRSEVLFAIARNNLPRPLDESQITNALKGGESGVCSFLNELLFPSA